ncbi:MAG: hypothetical protein ABEJ91_01715 [Candidatus Nanohaloarchaea archaeon]
MDVDQILQKYGLTKDTTQKYIDAITRLNQTETAQEIDVSRETINRYKKAFSRMTTQERSQLIASLTQDNLLKQVSNE